MMKKLVLILLSAFGALNSFSQLYNKTYTNTPEKGSFVNQHKHTSDQCSIILEMQICENNLGCVRISKVNKTGVKIWTKEKNYFRGNQRVLITRNDTIFYCGRNNTFNDSTYYWYFGMMSTDGDSIAEYKYPMLSINDGSITNYGLTLVGNDEVILWGEGLDNRMPNPSEPKPVPFRSAFLRLGLDGGVRTPLRWWELGTVPDRRMTDCTTDIDGSLAFSYNYNTTSGLQTYVIKLDQEDSFSIIGKTKSTSSEMIGFPRIAIDSKGNYFVQGTIDTLFREYATNESFPFITKIGRDGIEQWKEHIPIIRRQPWEFIYVQHLKVNRISTTQDDDVLVAGQCFLSDSFYIASINKNDNRFSDIGFIARFDKDGNVKWRHFLAPQMRNGDIQRNAILDIQESPDGTILVGGYILRDEPPYRTSDSWVMRLSADGCLNDACDHIEKYWHWPDTIVATVDVALLPLSIYPNPGTTACTIAIVDDVTLPLNYELIYSDGRRVEMGIHNTRSPLQLATDSYPSGMYLLRIRDARGQIGQGKWVKVR